MVGEWWANPLQTLSKGLVLTLRFTFGPELDNFLSDAGMELTCAQMKAENM